MDRIPRISVCMITYNQEKLVGRSLDSLLAQGEYLYEVCINDDCSTDNTFSVLLDYQKRYPNKIKPIRNQENLGIFQNIEASWKRPTGDMVYRLAGDDECPRDYFKSICDFVQKNNIDVINNAVCIYGNYVQRHVSGAERICTNHLVLHHDPVRLYCRALISNRSAVYSISILKQFINVSEGRSFKVEKTQEVELSLFTKKNYYIPVVGNIYYSGIGVSVKGLIDKNNIKDCYEHMTAFLRSQGYELKKSDKSFFKYRENYGEFLYTKSPTNLLLAFLYYLRSIDVSLGLSGMQFQKFLFSLRKKMNP